RFETIQCGRTRPPDAPRNSSNDVWRPQSLMSRPMLLRNSYSGPDASRNISISSSDSAKCVVNKTFLCRATSSQCEYRFFEAVNNACGAKPQFGADFSDPIARSTISYDRSGARTTISSANHQVRIGALIFGTRSGNAVRFAMVVVP